MPSFYATEVRITILSEDPLDQRANLKDLGEFIDTGDGVGGQLSFHERIVDAPTMAGLLSAFGSDPAFFRLDENGEEAADDYTPTRYYGPDGRVKDEL